MLKFLRVNFFFFFADKATDFTGKGRLGGEQEGKETRGRTALLHDLQL